MMMSDAGGAGANRNTLSLIRPRHVLCFLGGEHDLTRLADAASRAIGEFADGFVVSKTYSQDKPDARMGRSFDVSWDRVAPKGWVPADEVSVANHKCVLYVLGPPMIPETAVTISAAALQLVGVLIREGATAAKGESAGVAHGLTRWRQLIDEWGAALKAGDEPHLPIGFRQAAAGV